MGYRTFQTSHDISEELSLQYGYKRRKKNISKKWNKKRNKGEEFPKREEKQNYHVTKSVQNVILRIYTKSLVWTCNWEMTMKIFWNSHKEEEHKKLC